MEDYVANNARAYRPRYFTGDDSYEKDNFKQHKKKLDHSSVAYDPKTAEKVMRITEKIVKENALTTLMITHNISNAIEYGNKTIVMSQGKLLLTIEGEQRANMTVEKLMKLYSDTAEDELSDKMILQE